MKALGEGKIAPEEMPVDPKTKKETIRYMIADGGDHPYTIASLARFLGEAKADGKARDAFVTAFNAIELIDEGIR